MIGVDGTGGAKVARKKTIKRVARAEAVESDLLDAFFAALADADRNELLSTICDGVVTGAALSDKLDWRRDETSRQARILRDGGLIEAQREGEWKRFVPQLAGVEAAKAWAVALRASEPVRIKRPQTRLERFQRARVLANRGRRGLFTQVRVGEAVRQSELARACGLSQPQASRGLGRLVECGLVAVEHEGRLTRYSVCFDAIESVWAWFASAERKLTEGRVVAKAVKLPEPGTASVTSDVQRPKARLRGGHRTSGLP